MSDSRKLTIKYDGREQKLKLWDGHSTSSIESAIRARWQLPSDAVLALKNSDGKAVALNDSIASGVYSLVVETQGKCTNPKCPCGASCGCGASCQCGTQTESKGKCTNPSCTCGASCGCGASCQCGKTEAKGKCTNPKCTCGTSCGCGASCQCGTQRKNALLIIDVQYDFLPPTGSLAVTDGNAVIPIINNLRKKHKWDLIALTQDWHPKGHFSFASTNKDKGAKLFTPFEYEKGKFQMMWPDHCVQGSEGAKFHHELVIDKSDVIVQKGTHLNVDSYSGFYDNDHKSKTNLADTLKKHNITDVYCVGLAYDYCVGFSALDALKEGFKVYFLEDASRGVAPETTADMRKQLLAAGVHLQQSSDVRLQ